MRLSNFSLRVRTTATVLSLLAEGLVAFSSLRKCHDATLIDIPILTRSAMTNQNNSKRTAGSVIEKSVNSAGSF